MAEFRVKWEYNYANLQGDDPEDFYYRVKDIFTGYLILDVLRQYDDKLGLHDAKGVIQFNHSTRGWIDIDDDDDADENLEGEAYLSQSG